MIRRAIVLPGGSEQTAPPVIVTLPADLGGLQVLVQHYTWGVEVAVREQSQHAWTPAVLAGAEVEVRPS